VNRILRYLTLALLIGGALGCAAVAIWLSTLDEPSARAVVRGRGGELERGMGIIAHSPYAGMLYASLIAGAVVGLGLVVAALIRPWRWPFIAAAAVGIGAIYPVWRAQAWAAGFEFEGFRQASRYVEASEQLALAVTIYLIALAVLGAAAAALPRRS
jgi:hypothetical protein